MEPGELIWQGRIGKTSLRVGVSHAERIVAEWDSPTGPRHKISSSVAEFERSVLFQLLLNAGATDDSSTKEVVTAIEQAQAQRPAPPPAPRRRKNAKAKFHRRSRRAPRRR